jgi:hypothetical protein
MPTTTSYTVNLTMSSATVQALLNQGMQLIAFAAVQGTDLSAMPVVWSVSSTYGNDWSITWTTTYMAYASSSAISSGNMIQIATSQPIAVGQLLNVQQGPVTNSPTTGTPSFITITNTTTTQYSCGVEQSVNSGNGAVFAPVCVYPLYGLNTQTIAPLAEIVLLFTTSPLQVGEAWSGAPVTPGPFLELDAVTGPALWITAAGQSSPLSVQYDINTGWSWGGANWAMTISLSTLATVLIQSTSSPTLKEKR